VLESAVIYNVAGITVSYIDDVFTLRASAIATTVEVTRKSTLAFRSSRT